MTELYDIAVVGTGPVGACAALLMANRGFQTALIGPDISTKETRTAALLAGSVRLMQRLGVWDSMEIHGAPLRSMRLIDDTGRLLRAPTVTFEASEIEADHFGINIPVSAISSALNDAADRSENLTRMTAPVCGVETRKEAAVLSLSDIEPMRARLVIAADGRGSICRQSANIPVRTKRFAQAAFVLNLRTERSHDFISTEFHTPSGPFTLVPMPGRRVSLVCVVAPQVADQLQDMTLDDLSDELTRRSHSLLGRLTPEGPARSYPLGSQAAVKFGAGRTVLVGEAAHVMPPIGAQGLNLGFRDVASLADLLSSPDDLDDHASIVSAFDHARQLDVSTRMTAVNLLNQSLLSGFFGFQGARSVGLHALRSFAPLRKLVMKEGMQPSFSTPSLMRDVQVGA